MKNNYKGYDYRRITSSLYSCNGYSFQCLEEVKEYIDELEKYGY